MSSRVYLHPHPSIEVLLIGDSENPKAVVVLQGERREAFAPLTSEDCTTISALSQGNPVSRDEPLVDWLLTNNLAEARSESGDELPSDWSERWSRQLSAYSLFAGIDGAVDIHSQVTDSNVLIVGLGGIGCNVVQQLASIGVREFTFVDPDCVEASNLNRQILYSHEDVGDRKIDVAKRFIENRSLDGADVNVEGIEIDFLDWEPSTERLYELDLAVISADNRPAKIRRRACDLFYRADTAYGFASYSGNRATAGPLVFRTDRGCGNCKIMQIAVENVLTSLHSPDTRAIPPSSASRNGLLASTLVNQWVRSLNEASPPYSIVFDLDELTTTRIEQQRLPSCSVCGGSST